MTRWTTIPPWLYQNDLDDEGLQEVYVREAKKKVRQLAAELRDLDEERALLASALAKAIAFLDDAEAALARYRTTRRRKRLPAP